MICRGGTEAARTCGLATTSIRRTFLPARRVALAFRKRQVYAMLESQKRLSPRRNSTTATSIEELVAEQLAHFGIDAGSEVGQVMARIATRLYENQGDLERLWQLTFD